MKNSLNLNGLVLAGGKSLRMGKDKPSMVWHGVEQKFYLETLLFKRCENVFLSLRNYPEENLERNHKIIVDAEPGLGPLGAILTAFQTNPKSAWLVLASDLPLLTEDTIDFLIQSRDSTAFATTYQSPHDGLPEPLITIWEPAVYPLLLEYQKEGITCPRKALIRTKKVKMLSPTHPEDLMNVNTPEDLKKAEEILRSRKSRSHEAGV